MVIAKETLATMLLGLESLSDFELSALKGYVQCNETPPLNIIGYSKVADLFLEYTPEELQEAFAVESARRPKGELLRKMLRRHEITPEEAQEMFDDFYHDEYWRIDYKYKIELFNRKKNEWYVSNGRYSPHCDQCQPCQGKENNAVYRMEQTLHRKFVGEDDLRDALITHAQKWGIDGRIGVSGSSCAFMDLLDPTDKRAAIIPALFRNGPWGWHRYRGWYCIRDVVKRLRPFKLILDHPIYCAHCDKATRQPIRYAWTFFTKIKPGRWQREIDFPSPIWACSVECLSKTQEQLSKEYICLKQGKEQLKTLKRWIKQNHREA